MASLASGDRSGDRAIDGQRDSPRGRRARYEQEQTVADGEQTLADREQAVADRAQALADRDQAAADREQALADRDQDASDHDLAAGGDPAAHAVSRDMRERTARERVLSARTRLQIAAERDVAAQARDRAARARDVAADARDRAMDRMDAAGAEQDRACAAAGVDAVIRAGALRTRAAVHRMRAADDRAWAARDRARAAEDRAAAAREREHAQHDRLEALADRELLADALAIAETDAVTGARTRAAGLADLERELDRCRRTNGTLTVCYVDVVGLKAANDTHGHGAGDALLEDVVAGIRAHLRSYDVIIRVGGDEFVCALPNLSLSDARERFRQVTAALAAGPDPRAIRTGFAQLRAGECAGTLIGRADADLIAGRA